MEDLYGRHTEGIIFADKSQYAGMTRYSAWILARCFFVFLFQTEIHIYGKNRDFGDSMNYLWGLMILSGIVYAALHGTLPEVTQAAIDSSKEAVTLCVAMMGVMSLWVGLMRIAEKAGIIAGAVRGLKPFLRFLFPGIPKGHLANQYIAENFIAKDSVIIGLNKEPLTKGLYLVLFFHVYSGRTVQRYIRRRNGHRGTFCPNRAAAHGCYPVLSAAENTGPDRRRTGRHGSGCFKVHFTRCL